LVNAFIEAALANYPHLLEKSRRRARRRQQAAWLEVEEEQSDSAPVYNPADTLEIQTLRSPCRNLEVLHLDYNYIGKSAN